MRMAWLASMLGIVLNALAGQAHAAESYPTRPLRMVVPLFVGAGTDIIARQMANALSQALGQSVVVDNKPGASTTLGTAFVAKATPDGHTVLAATTSTLSVLPNIMKPPYDTTKDLVPVAAFCVSPFVYVVSAESKHTSLNDLIAAAKANPGKLSFGSSGTGTLTHMVVELLAVVAKVNFTHVPYKGVTGAYTDILGGRIDFVADSPASTLGQIKAGKFRAIAVTSPKRSPLLPAVPTVAELGMRDAESDFVTGLLLPAGSPRSVVTRLQSETLKIAHSQAFKDFLAQQGYESLAYDADQFTARIRSELAKWAGVVKSRNIKVE
ncbi:MAG: tripartite tricarboxylate transporter substrate binding protein [Burkholderiales bacterium]|nr:tripartite tricarboxylate transporter substrate binding protein [Burkholderiales bacterium]